MLGYLLKFRESDCSCLLTSRVLGPSKIEKWLLNRWKVSMLQSSKKARVVRKGKGKVERRDF